MKPHGITELHNGAGIPGWIEPPGSSGYRASQLRQLKQAVLWFVLILALLAAIAWPFIYYAVTDRNAAGIGTYHHARR
ncbi:MAG TPA: hypothetical protein ENO23_11690 [Alphaproteobacteria bacterium]|nr:hypothetical protein [Alphaproteobacteria bacterium]